MVSVTKVKHSWNGTLYKKSWVNYPIFNIQRHFDDLSTLIIFKMIGNKKPAKPSSQVGGQTTLSFAHAELI
jgi:hypothetical protein